MDLRAGGERQRLGLLGIGGAGGDGEDLLARQPPRRAEVLVEADAAAERVVGRPARHEDARARREWTSPSSPSAARERRTVWRFTPKRAESSASVGSRSPTAQWPRAISSASVPAMDFQIGVRGASWKFHGAMVASGGPG
jgi:hypothetical protein